MTSTPFNVGLDGSRVSSRVLRPPGGGHTDIFGSSEPEPMRGRRTAASCISGHVEEPVKPSNGTEASNQNGNQQEIPITPEPEPVQQVTPVVEAKTENPAQNNIPIDKSNSAPPKRTRVPPGGYSTGFCKWRQVTKTILSRQTADLSRLQSSSDRTPRVLASSVGNTACKLPQAERKENSIDEPETPRVRRGMEGGGRQSRLLRRLLGKLRGEHHHHRYNTLEKRSSVTSTGMSESTGTGCGSTTNDDDDIDPFGIAVGVTPTNDSSTLIDEEQFAANIDQRYGGQYLTPEQLPEFCDQLNNLVEVIRNIQSYARVTGEYPSKLECRLEQEAREVASLAAEARNAREVVMRTRAQRRAVRAQRKHLVSHLSSLKETEVRELESTIRLSDRKLFKSWEALKDSTDPKDFDPLLDEIKNKQTALECLVRLIESRRSNVARNVPPPQPLPPPMPRDTNGESSVAGLSDGHRRQERRGSAKRRRKDASREPRSVPLSGEPSHHEPQVTLYIQGAEHASRYRVGSAAAVALTPIELPSRGSVRDILFFTSNG